MTENSDEQSDIFIIQEGNNMMIIKWAGLK